MIGVHFKLEEVIPEVGVLNGLLIRFLSPNVSPFTSLSIDGVMSFSSATEEK